MTIESVNSSITSVSGTTRMSGSENKDVSSVTKETQINIGTTSRVPSDNLKGITVGDDEKKIKDAVEEINGKLTNTQTRCEYTVNEKVNRISIKIIDKQTDEVVREVPPEKTLKMIEKAWEIAGLIVDEKR